MHIFGHYVMLCISDVFVQHIRMYRQLALAVVAKLILINEESDVTEKMWWELFTLDHVLL